MDNLDVGLTISELQAVMAESRFENGEADWLSAAIAIQKKIVKKLKKAKLIEGSHTGGARKRSISKLPDPVRLLISHEDYKDLQRFAECKSFRLVNDVPLHRMEIMANLGLVKKLRGHYFEITGIGHAVLNNDIAVFSVKEVMGMVEVLNHSKTAANTESPIPSSISKVIETLHKGTAPVSASTERRGVR